MREVVDVKVDKDLKSACDDLFNALGLNTNTAINMFLAASLREMGIPFRVSFNENDCDCHCSDCDCDDCDCDDCENCDCE